MPGKRGGASYPAVASGAAQAKDQVRDEPRPAGLVRGAEARAGVAVEVLVERDQVLPGGVARRQAIGAEHRARAVLAAQEERDEPARQLVGDLREVQLHAGAGRALDREAGAEEAVVDAQDLDQEVVDRHPDRPSPVRVAPEEAARRLAR